MSETIRHKGIRRKASQIASKVSLFGKAEFYFQGLTIVGKTLAEQIRASSLLLDRSVYSGDHEMPFLSHR